MFTKKHEKVTSLDEEINRIFEKMKEETPGTDSYKPILETIERLYKLKPVEIKPKANMDWNTIITTGLTVGGSLGGILLIVFNEETRIITSKAMNFVMKGRA